MNNILYEHISKERITGVLSALQAYTGLAIDLLERDGTLLQSFGERSGYCALLQRDVFTAKECFTLHGKAGERAQATGEAYIFACRANLNLIAFPLIRSGELLGSVIVGPFLMDAPDSTLVSDLTDNYTLSPALILDLYDESAGLQVIAPARVNHLKKIIDYLLSPLISDEQALMRQTQAKMYQQARISEAIQVYKEQENANSLEFFYEKEQSLIAKVRTGDKQKVSELLNDLLGHVLFSEGGRVEAVRVLAIELTTLLSRVAMENSAKPDIIYKLNGNFLLLMKSEQSIDELCYLLQDAAENFMDAMFYEKDGGNVHIRKALKYVADHYSEKLTLETVANHVKLSSNYFSALFRDTVGESFREYVCRVRVEESKQLLRSTDYSITDIAVAMGFPDQSYYCKVFKSIVGITPGKYRA